MKRSYERPVVTKREALSRIAAATSNKKPDV